MRALSFDVGIKNLSYCDVDYSSTDAFTVRDWNTLDVTNGVEMDFHCLTEALIKLIHEKFFHTPSVYRFILIENQPVMKNPTMKSVQMVLYSVFKHYQYLHPNEEAYTVHLVSASSKLKCINLVTNPKELTNQVDEALNVKTTKNKAYLKRKMLSIAIAKQMLSQRSNAVDQALTTFAQHKKQDDMADTLNQALSFLSALKTT